MHRAGAGRLQDAGKVLDEWLALPNVLRVFRAHPDYPDFLFYKESLPFTGVWALHRGTDMTDTELFFAVSPLDKLQALALPWFLGIFGVLYLRYRRRLWLKRHAGRAPRHLWRQTLRLH